MGGKTGQSYISKCLNEINQVVAKLKHQKPGCRLINSSKLNTVYKGCLKLVVCL